MPIELSCPSCERRLRVADEHAGRKTRCPACRDIVVIPQLAVELESLDDSLAVEDDAALAAVPGRRACPACGELIMQTAVRCRFCRSPVDPDGHVVWRDGKILVMNRNAELPDRCIKTAEPAAVRKKIQLSWMPPGKQVLMVLLIGALLAHLVSVKATVHIPLSRAWAKRRMKQLLLGSGMAIVAIVVMIGTLVAEPGDAIAGVVVLSSIVVILAGIIVAVMAGSIVTLTRITDSYIWLKGAKPVFLDTLPEWHGIE